MRRHDSFWVLILLAVLLPACSPVSPSSILFPTRTPTASATASLTVVPTPTFTPTIVSTATPAPTLTPIRTPPALPGPYQSALLNPLDTPHAYVQEPCLYLHDKWTSTNSVPGTVVMAIMFHRIKNETVTTPEEISEYDFRRLMKTLHENGFQAIDTTRLIDFLERNASIPERSVLMVADDKHTSEYFNGFFRQYHEEWGWPVVNAWVSDEKTSSDLWQQQEALNAEGWVDYQAHGVVHTPPIDRDSTDAYILGELQGSIDMFHENFDKTPLAIIWPGGGFTPHAAGIARQLGYRLGFTTNPRGPLMFNWVPLADSGDPLRPTWIPEGSVNDPLMVLPRYWDTDATKHLDEVLQMAGEAAAYAEQNKATELEYYDIVCAAKYGPIP